MSVRDICIPILRALFTRAKTWKQAKSALTHKWIKQNITYTYKQKIYQTVIQPSKAGKFAYATSWTNLEDVMLNEIS